MFPLYLCHHEPHRNFLNRQQSLRRGRGICKEEGKEEDKTGGEGIIISITWTIINNSKLRKKKGRSKMPKKQRNRNKNKIRNEQIEEEKQFTRETLDISQEILDELEEDEDCKLTYIFGQPPLLKIQRKGKGDIITPRFSIDKPYEEKGRKSAKVVKEKKPIV